MDSNSLQLAEISNTSNDLSTKFDLKNFMGAFFKQYVYSISHDGNFDIFVIIDHLLFEYHQRTIKLSDSYQ